MSVRCAGLFGSILLASLLGAQADEPMTIDFDDLAAPCDLGSAQPLRDVYAALGVEFNGNPDDGGAVLDECSGLGVPGYSSPNFVVIDPEGVLADGGVPDGLHFGFTGDAPNYVSVKIGGTLGTAGSLQCTICPWSVPWCDVWQDFVLDSSMQSVDVSTDYAFPLGCSVRIEGPVGTMIVDDLKLGFQLPGASIPSLSPVGAASLSVIVAALGFLLIRRWSNS